MNPQDRLEAAAQARESNQQAERDWQTTLEIVKQAVLSFGSSPPASDLELQKRCEAVWQWAKSDNWRPPQ